MLSVFAGPRSAGRASLHRPLFLLLGFALLACRCYPRFLAKPCWSPPQLLFVNGKLSDPEPQAFSFPLFFLAAVHFAPTAKTPLHPTPPFSRTPNCLRRPLFFFAQPFRFPEEPRFHTSPYLFKPLPLNPARTTRIPHNEAVRAPSTLTSPDSRNSVLNFYEVYDFFGLTNFRPLPCGVCWKPT